MLTRLGPRTDGTGDRTETPVIDDDALSLLERIMKQLKIMNLHMSVMTDNTFKSQDVE